MIQTCLKGVIKTLCTLCLVVVSATMLLCLCRGRQPAQRCDVRGCTSPTARLDQESRSGQRCFRFKTLSARWVVRRLAHSPGFASLSTSQISRCGPLWKSPKPLQTAPRPLPLHPFPAHGCIRPRLNPGRQQHHHPRPLLQHHLRHQFTLPSSPHTFFTFFYPLVTQRPFLRTQALCLFEDSYNPLQVIHIRDIYLPRSRITHPKVTQVHSSINSNIKSPGSYSFKHTTSLCTLPASCNIASRYK